MLNRRWYPSDCEVRNTAHTHNGAFPRNRFGGGSVRKLALFALSCCLVSALPPLAQATVPRQQRFGTHSVARIIDVIVRDKKGKPVTGLQRDDFRLTEDGTPQQILDFSAVTPSSPPPASALTAIPVGGVTSPASTDRGHVDPSRLTTAIVFERLTPESREPAKLAALKMLEGAGKADELFGVFVLDLSLRTLQPFTSDRTSLRKAVTIASTISTSYFEQNRIGIAADGRPPSLAESSEAIFKELTRIQAGYATTNAFEALSTAMAVIPGRKTILYFSDGLPAQSDANQVRLNAAIATANRYNVAIYPVDTVGLRVHSQEVANGEALRGAVLKDMDAAGAARNDLGGGGATYVGEYIERSGTTARVFDRIASGTGAFVVEDTNDLRRGVAAIDSDRRFYYLLMYDPTNKLLDGTWRAVSVTVPRGKVIVRARAGYIAAPE